MLGERLVECVYIYIYMCVCVCVEALLLSGRASFVSLSSRLRRDAVCVRLCVCVCVCV